MRNLLKSRILFKIAPPLADNLGIVRSFFARTFRRFLVSPPLKCFLGTLLAAGAVKSEETCFELQVDQKANVGELIRSFLWRQEFNTKAGSQDILERYLLDDSSLINEPIFRLFQAYSYALSDSSLGVFIHTEAAERLSLRRNDCDMKRVIDMAQSLRISATFSGLHQEPDATVYRGYASILTGSAGNRLLENDKVMCAALHSILLKSRNFEKADNRNCKIRSILGE